LVVLSDPKDVAKLDVESEWDRLQTALADLQTRGLIALERLAGATLESLQRRLRQTDAPVHILHFIGHGDYDEKQRTGGLLWEDAARYSRFVSADILATLLYDHPSLRLAFLNACEGARSGPADLFAGVAQTLVQKRLPAVIAMQYSITDPAAIHVAHEFYQAIAASYPVDAALAEARKALYREGNQLEWGTPVLFMRAADGNLFRFGDHLNPQKISIERDNFATEPIQRRIDAAVSSNAQIGEQIDLLVQVRLPDSPLLGLNDWQGDPPASIKQAMKQIGLKFPVDTRTGKLKPLRLKVRVEAPDFRIEGTIEEVLEIPPNEESECLTFLLTPKKAGNCRIHIKLYDVESTYLGVIPLMTAVGKATPEQPPTVAYLTILVMVEPNANLALKERTMTEEKDSGNQRINTGGGAFIGGGVNTGGGDFVGRDKVVRGDEVHGDKVRGNKVTGDVITANIGAGAKNIAVGKDIRQTITETVGPPTPDDKKIIEAQFQRVLDALNAPTIDPRKAGRAEGNLETLKEELTKTGADEMPNASTISRVGDWLLDNVPELTQALTELFGMPAVGRVIAKAGDSAVAWLRRRFG